MTAWDQLFVPGMYEIKEFAVDANMQPIAKTVKRKRHCFTAGELQQVSRLPVTTAFAWRCQPTSIRLESPQFGVTMSCEADAASGFPVAGLAVVGATGPDTFASRLMKTAIDTASGKEKLLFGAGSSFKRLGSCK